MKQTAAFVVPRFVELTIYSGASVVHVSGPARLTESVTGNHGDLLVAVSEGVATAAPTDGGGPVSVGAGGRALVKGPRGS